MYNIPSARVKARERGSALLMVLAGLLVIFAASAAIFSYRKQAAPSPNQLAQIYTYSQSLHLPGYMYSQGNYYVYSQSAYVPGGPLPISSVQGNTHEFTSTSTLALAYQNSQIAGDLNVVIVGWHGSANSISSVSDSKGNVYSLAIGPTRGTNLSQSIYYAKNIKGGASNRVTVKYAYAANNPTLIILEYKNVDASSPFVAAHGNAGSATLTAQSGAINSVPAGSLLLGAGITNVKFKDGDYSPFVLRGWTPDHNWSEAEDLVAPSTGSSGPYNATAPLSTSTSSYYVMQLAAFKPAYN
jgi:hypothetical protein